MTHLVTYSGIRTHSCSNMSSPAITTRPGLATVLVWMNCLPNFWSEWPNLPPSSISILRPLLKRETSSVFIEKVCIMFLNLGPLGQPLTMNKCFFKYVPILASFIYFCPSRHITIQIEKAKSRCCAWDSTPGPQDGRQSRI